MYRSILLNSWGSTEFGVPIVVLIQSNLYFNENAGKGVEHRYFRNDLNLMLMILCVHKMFDDALNLISNNASF